MSGVCQGPRTVSFMLIVLGRRKAETQYWDTGADQGDGRAGCCLKSSLSTGRRGHGVDSWAEGKGGFGPLKSSPAPPRNMILPAGGGEGRKGTRPFLESETVRLRPSSCPPAPGFTSGSFGVLPGKSS